MKKPYSFIIFTFFALLGLVIITGVGSQVTTRPKTPSISVIIDDEPAIRFVFGLYVSALTISRTGLVFTSTFYKLRDGSWWMDVFWPGVAATCGALQLVSSILVGMFSVTQDQTYHYVAAGGSVFFALICEIILFYRRVRWYKYKISFALFANVVSLFGILVCMSTYVFYTQADLYSELRVNSALAEWIGYYFVAQINVYRTMDVKIHLMQDDKRWSGTSWIESLITHHPLNTNLDEFASE